MRRYFQSTLKTLLPLFLLGGWLFSWGLLGHIHADKLTHTQCQTCVSQAQFGSVLLQASPAQVVFSQVILSLIVCGLIAKSVSFTAPYFQRGPPAFILSTL